MDQTASLDLSEFVGADHKDHVEAKDIEPHAEDWPGECRWLRSLAAVAARRGDRPGATAERAVSPFVAASHIGLAHGGEDGSVGIPARRVRPLQSIAAPRSARGSLWLLIVIARLQEHKVIPGQQVHQPVLLRDASRPGIGDPVFQRLRFADPPGGVAQSIIN